MVEELKVHNHGFVATREGSTIPHKTDQEDDFVTYLKSKKKNKNLPLIIRVLYNLLLIILICTN